MSNPFYEASRRYLELGFNPIPLLPCIKKPAIEWLEYQKHRITKEQIEQWESQGLWNGVAVICGKISRNLIVQDFESYEAFEEFYDNRSEEILRLTMVVSTPHDGIHVWFTSSQTCKRQIRISEEPPLDLLGEGGYAVAPPTIIDHQFCDKKKCTKQGRDAYQLLSKDYRIKQVPDIQRITIDRCRELGWTVKDASRRASASDLLTGPIIQGQRKSSAISVAGRARWVGLGGEDLLAFLRYWNQTRCQPPLEDDEILDIWKSAIGYNNRKGRFL